MTMLNAFLLTYKGYINSSDLMDLLISRYNLPKPKNADLREKFKTTKEDPIHLRIFNFLKNWIGFYFSDFFEDGDLREKFYEFLDNQFSGSMEKAAETLRRAMQKQMVRERREKKGKVQREAEGKEKRSKRIKRSRRREREE